MALILATQYHTLEVFRPRVWIGIMLLLAASLGKGRLCGGPARATRRTLAVAAGVRNAAVGLVIVSANFAGTPAVTAVVGYALVSVFGTLGWTLLSRQFPVGQTKEVPFGSLR
jgi:predicted Na+-dependent transporter